MIIQRPQTPLHHNFPGGEAAACPRAVGPGVLSSILRRWRSDWALGFLGERELHGGFLKDDSWVWARFLGLVTSLKRRSPVAFGLKVVMNSKHHFEIPFTY